MATDAVDKLLNEFIEAWNAAGRPRVNDYVERAPEDQRDELAGLISAFLELASTPDYSPQQLAELRQDPTVKAVAALVNSPSGLWPTLLPRLRKRARLTRDEVVSQLAGLLGISGREDKLKRYYHQMEAGTIEPAGVSRTVLAGLGTIFSVGVGELERAGDFGAPALAGESLYMRAMEGHELETVARMERVQDAGPASREWDEVDELFRGGR